MSNQFTEIGVTLYTEIVNSDSFEIVIFFTITVMIWLNTFWHGFVYYHTLRRKKIKHFTSQKQFDQKQVFEAA